MKQFYYTSCVPGRSVSGQGGFQVRAVTAGLAQDRQRSLLRHAGYALPSGFDDDTPTNDAPLRLALLDSDNGRILCQSVYVGRDPTTNRTGNFFTHTLVDVPDDLDAKTAAQLYDASGWERRDSDNPTELPELNRLWSERKFDASKLRQFAATHADLVKFLFLGLLTIPEHQRLFVVAPPDVICQAIAYVSERLPPGMARALTFSTFEKDPLSSPARVIGTVWRSETLDLPPTCYDGAGLGFNSLNGKSSPLPPPSEFATFVLGETSERHDADLASFYETCRGINLSTPDAWDLAFRLLRGKDLPCLSDFLKLIDQPGLLQKICARDGMDKQLAEWAITDAEFRGLHLPGLSKSINLDAVANLVWQNGISALRAANINRAKIALAEVPKQLVSKHLPAVGTTQFNDSLEAEFHDESLPFASRCHVLPYVMKSEATRKQSAREHWLKVPPDKLQDLLDVKIEERDQVTACLLSLRRVPVAQDEALFQAIAAKNGLAIALLDEIGSRPEWNKTASELIAALFAKAFPPTNEGLFENARNQMKKLVVGESYAPAAAIALVKELAGLHARRRLSSDLLDRGLCIVFEHPAFLPIRFIATPEWDELSSSATNETSQKQLSISVLSAQAIDFRSKSTRSFLNWLGTRPWAESLPPANRKRFQQLRGLVAFMEAPGNSEEKLKLAFNGLPALSDQKEGDDYWDYLQKKILEELVLERGSGVAHSLERVLNYLAGEQIQDRRVNTGWWNRILQRIGLRREESSGIAWVARLKELITRFEADPRTSKNSKLIVAVAGIGFGSPAVELGRSSISLPADELQDLIHRTVEFLRKVAPARGTVEFGPLESEAHELWPKQSRARAWWEHATTRAEPQSKNPDATDRVLWWLILTIVVLMVLLVLYEFGHDFLRNPEKYLPLGTRR